MRLSVQLRRMGEGVEGFTWDEIRGLHSELVLRKRIECLEIVSEEKMQKVLNMYQQRRETRNLKMAKLSNMMSRMAKVLRRVSSGKGVGTVPDLEGCLRDCTTCLEDETKEEWGNLVEPLVRAVVDKIQELMDLVKLAWVEMGMEERLHKPILERCAVKREAVSISEVPQCDEVTVQDEKSVDQDLLGVDAAAGDMTGRGCELGDRAGRRGSSCDQGLARSALSDGLCGTGSVKLVLAHGDVAPISREDYLPVEAFGEELEPALSSLSVGLDCQPLASSTPRSVRSLSICMPVDNDNNTSSESGLLETGELLSLVEQFAGVVSSTRMSEELAKLDRGTGFVRWKSFERRLEEDPGIVFGDI